LPSRSWISSSRVCATKASRVADWIRSGRVSRRQARDRDPRRSGGVAQLLLSALVVCVLHLTCPFVRLSSQGGRRSWRPGGLACRGSSGYMGCRAGRFRQQRPFGDTRSGGLGARPRVCRWRGCGFGVRIVDRDETLTAEGHLAFHRSWSAGFAMARPGGDGLRARFFVQDGISRRRTRSGEALCVRRGRGRAGQGVLHQPGTGGRRGSGGA